MINDETMNRLKILTEVAKFDVSCASSGVNRGGAGSGTMGNSLACGICHSFTEDGRCISLLKLLQSNDCIFDCKYCLNRRTNDIVRTSLTPEEVAEITVEFYRRNYIEGLFLSSAVRRSPDDTMADMIETMKILRFKYGFWGYIHCKTIPGASSELVETAGMLADRISVNIELPGEESLKRLAPQKKIKNIIGPMKYIAGRIEEDRSGIKRLSGGTFVSELNDSGSGTAAFTGSGTVAENVSHPDLPGSLVSGSDICPTDISKGIFREGGKKKRFAPGGQSTQMIVGATEDTDLQIIRLSEAFYRKLSLKRVYYSAYVPINKDADLPDPGTPTPLLREHRLYQADWLLRYYGFSSGELLDEKNPQLDPTMDPKCFWAVRHRELFPVEINKADYEMILRVPGIGVISAKRIIRARRICRLDFPDLIKMGVVMKRAKYFITCKGRMMAGADPDTAITYLGPALADAGPVQLSLFDNAAVR